MQVSLGKCKSYFIKREKERKRSVTKNTEILSQNVFDELIRTDNNDEMTPRTGQ